MRLTLTHIQPKTSFDTIEGTKVTNTIAVLILKYSFLYSSYIYKIIIK